MSGVKYSQVEIEQMRKAHQDALQKASGLESTVGSLSKQAASILSGIPQGVKQSFVADIEQVKRLLSDSSPTFSSSMGTQALIDVSNRMNKVIESRRKAIRLLCSIREEKREQKAQELIASFEELKCEWSGISALLDKWRPGEVSSQVSAVQGVEQQVTKGEFVSVDKMLSQSRGNLENLTAKVNALETQDQERRFVLGALKDVCESDMGWKEVGISGLQAETNPESPIVARFNTYSDGIIEFILRMDGIETHSDFSNEKHGCYKQFDSLSEQLRKVGVNTRFRRKGEENVDPDLKKKGELDEPHGAEAVGVMHKEC